MNHHTAALFGAALAAAVGLAGGWILGDLVRRYRHGVEQLDALRRQLPQPCSAVLLQERQLRQIRRVLNDLHKMVRGVTKSLEKLAEWPERGSWLFRQHATWLLSNL
ncbi:MAG TPA: hypothetical protein VMH80_07785 [Bryobacteraceae bacterium]|nr:hypothetical protein [Bryobacteraceae bacterium]